MVDEVSKAIAGTGNDLQRLIDSGDELSKAATEALPQTISLIEDGNTVLRTQNSEATSIRTFADQLAKLTDTLRASDPRVPTVLDQGTVASNELTDVLRKNEKTLPVLLGNLISAEQVVKCAAAQRPADAHHIPDGPGRPAKPGP